MVDFVPLMEFSDYFTCGGVMAVDIDASELLSETGGNSGGFGESFVSKIDGLIWGRVRGLARQRAEKPPEFFGVCRVGTAGDVFGPSLEGFVSGLLSYLAV